MPDIRDRIVDFRRVRRTELEANPENWRLHPDRQKSALMQSLERIGITGALLAYYSGYKPEGEWKLEEAQRLGKLTLIDGHLRRDAAALDWPTLILDVNDQEAREVLATYDVLTGMAVQSDEKLSALLASLSTTTRLPPMLNALRDVVNSRLELIGAHGKRPPRRKAALDLIFCTPRPSTLDAWIAHDAGFLIGLNSGKGKEMIAQVERWAWRYPITFIDNDYANYDHELHMAAVRHFKPKYATTRDIMTEAQCEEAGIAYYSFEQIMDWAKEVEQYAEHVIIIPKVDCLAEIPEKYLLGYSVLSSYGVTPIPLSKFKAAPQQIHLLGGNWPRQLEVLSVLKDQVVSVDINSHLKIADYGQVVTGEGEGAALEKYEQTISDIAQTSTLLQLAALQEFPDDKVTSLDTTAPQDLAILGRYLNHLGQLRYISRDYPLRVTNVRSCCMALSSGAIAYAARELTTKEKE